MYLISILGMMTDFNPNCKILHILL